MSILVFINVLRFNLRIDILNSIKASWETTTMTTTWERRERELSSDSRCRTFSTRSEYEMKTDCTREMCLVEADVRPWFRLVIIIIVAVALIFTR